MKYFVFTLFLSCIAVTLSAEPFPGDYVGTWQGKCLQAGTQSSFDMQLVVKAETATRYQWQTTYRSSTTNQVRNYHLILDPKKPFNFVIDENNGLLLDGFVTANKMVQLFSLDSGVIIYVQYDIVDGELIAHLPSWTSRNPRVTTTHDGKNTVRSFRTTGLQECRLRKRSL